MRTYPDRRPSRYLVRDTRAQFSPYWGDATPIAGVPAGTPGASDYGCPPCIIVAAVVPAVLAAGVAIYSTERQRATTEKLAKDQKQEAARQEKRLADQDRIMRDALKADEKRAADAQKAAASAAAATATAAAAASAAAASDTGVSMTTILLGVAGLGVLYALTK
jgi:Flp pilus assembly protein TadB